MWWWCLTILLLVGKNPGNGVQPHLWWWLTISGMVGCHSLENGWPSFGKFLTIFWTLGDHPGGGILTSMTVVTCCYYCDLSPRLSTKYNKKGKWWEEWTLFALTKSIDGHKLERVFYFLPCIVCFICNWPLILFFWSAAVEISLSFHNWSR